MEVQETKQGILASVAHLFRSKDNVNLGNVRMERLKYMLIFPLAPVFANMQGAWFSDSATLFGLSAMTVLGSAYCVGAGALFALTNVDNMAKVSRILAIATALTYIPWIFMPESGFSLIVAVCFMLGLGGSAACAAFAYTFSLNNTERLLGAAGISLFFSLCQLDFGLSFLAGFFGRTYLTLLVAGTCACLIFYKDSDFERVADKPQAVWNSAIKLTLYFFVAHYFVEIFYTYLPGASTRSAIIANGIVGVLVVCLSVALQLMTKSSIWHMCNLFFIGIISTYLLHFAAEGSVLRNLARFTHGFEQMGYIAAYYLLGCVFKKHGDFRIFKLSLVTILPISMISYVIPGVFSAHAPNLLPLAATLVSGLVFVAFILMSPLYSKHLFSADWSGDFHSVDMTHVARTGEQADTILELNLSARERETLSLLLDGQTAKQISGELSISVHTANFHIKNIYKKLNVSKRSELFALFSGTASSKSRTITPL